MRLVDSATDPTSRSWQVVTPQLMGRAVRRRPEIGGAKKIVHRQSFALSMVAVAALAVACTDNLGPDRGDPAQYVLDPVRYACGGWSPSEPNVNLGLFDIFWGLRELGDVGTGPRSEHRAAVLEAGGTLVHQFNVPMIRAILSLRRVPELGANLVTGVPDASVFIVDVGVGYSRRLTDSDIDFFESLGGAVTHRFTSINAIAGELPDSAIPMLRARPEVRYVEGNGVSCLAGR